MAALIHPNFGAARSLASSFELAALAWAARAGLRERVTLRAIGSFTTQCECPPFALDIAGPDGSSRFVIAVPSKDVPDILTRRTALQFVLHGHFSGAQIDTYAHLAAVGAPAQPDEEQSETWLEQYPEFCLEAWCFVVPPWSDEYADVREVARDNAKELRELGVRECPRSVPRARPH